MKRVIDIVERSILISSELNNHLAAMHRLSGSEIPINGLNIVNNHCVMTLESLLNYNKIWCSPGISSYVKVEKIEEEKAQRVVGLNRSSFISTISAFEFCAKQAILSHPGKIPRIKGRIYLKKIIEESVRANLIPLADELVWEGVIELRNSLVHNNGIAEKTKSYAVPGAQNIEFISGQMGGGKVDFFPAIQLWSIEAFARWCAGFLK